MPKRRFISDTEKDDNGYADVECPDCGAIINAHFQRGRKWRRLQCPVCRHSVTISMNEHETPLIQLRRAPQNDAK